MRGKTIHPIILAGGFGTRLWPLSRELFPKQYHRLTNGTRSLLQETVLRLAKPSVFTKPVMVANEAHRFILGVQLQEIGAEPAAILLEPSVRGTAPAIAAASLLPHIDDDALLLAVPTDHFIASGDAFCKAVEDAVPAARDGFIVTFGLVPERAETGYGYIHAGGPLDLAPDVRGIRAFHEKPPLELARQFQESGQHFWNMGVFLFKKSTLLSEFALHAPDVLKAAAASASQIVTDMDFLRLDAKSFEASPNVSIDRAIMEKSARGAVKPVSFSWSDLGTWSALWDVSCQAESSSSETVCIGDVSTWDVTRSYIRSDSGLVVAIGVSDLVVVTSGDATLVASRSRAGDVGRAIDKLGVRRRREAQNHLLVHRPWGHFLTLAEGPGYQVKILTLNPGAAISHQYHRQRAERWVVVEGNAEVSISGRIVLLKQHESIEIRRGESHRLSNPGSNPLKVIEVQSGDYLGEDDIVRLD